MHPFPPVQPVIIINGPQRLSRRSISRTRFSFHYVNVSPTGPPVTAIALQHFFTSNSIFDPPAWNLATLLALFPAPTTPLQQQAWWHSRWQWPQERRVHPQQQSTLAPYRHRPLDEAICRGHLWGDDIISFQPIKMSKWKAGGLFNVVWREASKQSFRFSALEKTDLFESFHK